MSTRSQPLLETALFILVSYIRCSNIKVLNIPIDIEYLTLKNIGIDVLLQLNIYFINTMIKLQQYKTANNTIKDIRKHILLHGCPEYDIISERDEQSQDANNISSLFNLAAAPTIRKNEDTTRGKLWKLFIGLGYINSTKYHKLIQKGESMNQYVKIRGDTKRTFLTSREYNGRVSENRIVRLLNSYVHETEKRYLSGMDTMAGILLYVMPELDAYESFLLLMRKSAPTYFYGDCTRKYDLIGSYAGSFLAWDILKICDEQLFAHLKQLPPHTYFFPLIACFQTICKPFREVPKLWDFLFCFGFYLCPVMAAAHIISNRTQIMEVSPIRLLQTLLSQRKFMNKSTNAKDVINCSVKLIEILQQPQYDILWNNIFYHATDLNIAMIIKTDHEQPHETSNKQNDVMFESSETIQKRSEQIAKIDVVENHNPDTNILTLVNNVETICEEINESKQNNHNLDATDHESNIVMTIKREHEFKKHISSVDNSQQINTSKQYDNNENKIDTMPNDVVRTCDEIDEDNTTESSTDESTSDSTQDTTESSSSSTSSSSDWSDIEDNYDDQDNYDLRNYDRRFRNRFAQLNEFKLENKEIELFNMCQEKHNEGINQYHSGCEFMDKYSINNEIIKYWKMYSEKY